MGYAAFYRVEQTARCAPRSGAGSTIPATRSRAWWPWPSGAGPVGLAHFRPFARPLAASIGGFLDDLFVAPEARGSGAAQALIEAVAATAASAAGRYPLDHGRGQLSRPRGLRPGGGKDQMAHLRDQARLKLRLSRLGKAWPDLRRALQTALAATATLALAGVLHLPESSWAVVTAVLVVQARIGGSLTLAMDRLAATLLGAVVGVATVTALGLCDPTQFAVLFVAVLALAYATSRKASLRRSRRRSSSWPIRATARRWSRPCTGCWRSASARAWRWP